MEEQPNRNEPERKIPAETTWEETKRQAQGAFSEPTDNRVVIDRIHVQRLLNAKFWENEILHETSDLTRDAIEKQPDVEGPER